MAKTDSTRLLATALFRKLRNNAARRNIPVSICADDIHRLMRTQRMKCAVSGVRFDDRPRSDGGRVRPLMPSVDRIDARKAYDLGNIRIVCAAVNAALGDWGDETFRLIILGAAHLMGIAAVPAHRSYPRGVVGRSHKNGVRFEALIRWRDKRWYLGAFRSADDAGEYYAKVRAALMAGDDIAPYLPKARRCPIRNPKNEPLPL